MGRFMRFLKKSLFLSFLLIFGCVSSGEAQNATTTVNGTVTDAQGRAVAGASVVLTNLGSGGDRATVTDASGAYRVEGLPVGDYRVTVESAGFSTASREIRLNQPTQTLPSAVLEPGNIREIVTVVAQRTARDIMTTPESVSVVSARQLEERTPGTAVDPLRDLPGTYTQSQGFLTRPIIRGLEGNRVLVLVDGERLNNGRTPTSHVGNGVETGLIDVGSLDSIEVIRGAGSVLYGTEALGGTINFITRPPVKADKGVQFSGEFDPFFTSNGPGGRYGGNVTVSTSRFSVRLRQSFENFSDYQTGDPVESGYRSVTPQFNAQTRNADRSAYRTNATRVEGRYFFNEKLFARSSYERTHAGPYSYPLQSTFDFLFSDREKVNFGFVARELSPVIAGIQVGGYYQWQNRRDQIVVNVPNAIFQVTDRQINPTTVGFDGQINLTPFAGHVLTGGVSFYRDTSRDDRVVVRGTNPAAPGGLTPAQAQINAARLRTDPEFLRSLRLSNPRRDVPNASFQDIAFFAQDEVRVNRFLRVVGGLRVDRYSSEAEDTPSFDIFNVIPPGTGGVSGLQSLRHANTAITGSGGVVFNPIEQVSLVARLGRSYREPNIFDRYNAGASHSISPTTSTVTIPNPNLKPETGINLDTGVKVRFARLAGSFTYFNNTYDNFIGNFGAPLPGVAPIPNPIPGGRPLTVLQRQNLNRVRMQGVEAELEVPFRLPEAFRNSFLTFSGNLGYTRGDDVKTGLPVDPFNFPVVPLKTVVGLRWNTATNRYWSEYRARIVNTQNRVPAGSIYLQAGTARLGFTVHDLRGGMNFNREHYGISLTVGVENLGNRFYQDLFSLFDAPARGRSFVTGLRLRFF